jgi:hypothetical protein
MPLLDLIAALGLLAAAALAAVTVLTAVLFGLSRLETATVPAPVVPRMPARRR